MIKTVYNRLKQFPILLLEWTGLGVMGWYQDINSPRFALPPYFEYYFAWFDGMVAGIIRVKAFLWPWIPDQINQVFPFSFDSRESVFYDAGCVVLKGNFKLEGIIFTSYWEIISTNYHKEWDIVYYIFIQSRYYNNIS